MRKEAVMMKEVVKESMSLASTSIPYYPLPDSGYESLSDNEGLKKKGENRRS